MFLFFLLALVVVDAAYPGACPNVGVFRNLDPARNTGVWYEIARTPNNNVETTNDCVILNATANGDGYVMRFSQVNNGVQEYLEGANEQIPNDNNEARFIYTILYEGTIVQIPPIVLETDYDNYSICYSCKYNANTNTHSVNFWIMAKTTQLQGKALAFVNSYIQQNAARLHLNPSSLVYNDFSKQACSYYRLRNKGIPESCPR